MSFFSMRLVDINTVIEIIEEIPGLSDDEDMFKKEVIKALKMMPVIDLKVPSEYMEF